MSLTLTTLLLYLALVPHRWSLLTVAGRRIPHCEKDCMSAIALTDTAANEEGIDESWLANLEGMDIDQSECLGNATFGQTIIPSIASWYT